MSISGSLSMKLQGFPPANRDAVVKLTNTATGQTLERKPFADGSLVVRDVDPGPWEVEVVHPNLLTPVFRDVVRVIPQLRPTFVPIPIRPDLFVDNPIRDIPDADLTPVQQTATSVRSRLEPVGGKGPGEVIRADDWNQLVSAVSDLAGAVLELTHLVTPVGHDHPEIAAKIDEVQGNVRRFTESFGRSLLELRRDIENKNLQKIAVDVFDRAGASETDRRRILDRIDDLELSLNAPTVEFTNKLAVTGTALATEINRLAQTQGAEAATFLAAPDVQKALVLAQELSAGGGQVKAESELETYRRTAVATGSKLSWAGG